MRRAARVDVGQESIVIALRACGVVVQSLAAVGHGCPDLLVSHRGVNYLLEVKEPLGAKGGKSRKGQHLTPDQERWHRAWRGKLAVVRTIDDAFDAIGVPRPGAKAC